MVIDLHCDLLSYLAKHPYNLAYDKECRASIPQLLEGGVEIQTCAIFTETGPKSTSSGWRQALCYKELSQKYKGYFSSKESKGTISTKLAIENASGFCEEKEPLQKGIERLKKIVQEIEKPLYITLTWHTENRFGGGNMTNIGLKEDGKRLLSQIEDLTCAIDFSHTSDKLAYDILNFIDKEKLSYKVLASHSNFRSVKNVDRNLPDDIADEIVKRGGVIGVNVICDFVGKSIDAFQEHIAFALDRGYGNNIAFGLDFFYDGSLPTKFRDKYGPFFFPDFDSASCYPRLQKLLSKVMSKDAFEKLSHKNAKRFFTSVSG